MVPPWLETVRKWLYRYLKIIYMAWSCVKSNQYINNFNFCQSRMTSYWLESVIMISSVHKCPLSASPAWAGDSHLIGTAWWHSAGRWWTSSDSCASQSGIFQRQSGPFGSSHFQTLLSGGLFRSFYQWKSQTMLLETRARETKFWIFFQIGVTWKKDHSGGHR